MADTREGEARTEPESTLAAQGLGLKALAGIVEASLDGIAIADQQGNFAYANRAACAILGYSLEDLDAEVRWQYGLFHAPCGCAAKHGDESSHPPPGTVGRLPAPERDRVPGDVRTVRRRNEVLGTEDPESLDRAAIACHPAG